MKCALVTGATKGIGKEIAYQLALNHQYHILLNYVSDEILARKTLTEFLDKGFSAELIRFDVSEKNEVDNAINHWHKNNPNTFLEVLVNNAGITGDSLFYWMQEEQWDRVIDISLKGMFNVTKAVLPSMMLKKYGRIINISSIAASKALIGLSNYSAAKAGMEAATRTLSLELAKMNITVNAVAPGFIETDMTQVLEMQKMIKHIPMNRLGKAQEVAHLVSFLAGKNAAYITGETIKITGGM